MVTGVYRMATSGKTNATSASSSSSAYSNSGFYDDEQDEDDNMTKGGSYIDIPISNPSNEVKKLLIENIPLHREQLRTVISRASFQVSNFLIYFERDLVCSFV
jgi:hypothetical protein